MPARLQFTGLLLLASFRLLAQGMGAVLPVHDSAYAVRNMFRERRAHGLKGASLGLAGLSGAVFEVVNQQPRTSAAIVLATAFFTVLDIRLLNRYDTSREELVVRRYEQGWPLPPDVRRRLRTKHFKAMAL
jgi:hypothetical protein